MPLALVTATPAEMRAALAVAAPGLDAPERGLREARIAGRDFLLVVTGVGPVSAALELGAALASVRVGGALNLGLAGSFDLHAAPLGACVAASAEVLAEYGVTGDDGLADATGFAFPQWEGAGTSVAQRLELDPAGAAARMGLALSPGTPCGPALTVAGVTGSFGRAQALASRHAALTESMEGFALALACLTRGVPFLEVRTVSNQVGERDRARWRIKQALSGLGELLAGLVSGPRQTGSDPSK